MSTNFLTPLVVEPLDDERKWRIVEPFDYIATFGTISWTISVPVDFITDFASIPRAFWSILPPTGRYGKAAVIHDFLYIQANAKIPGTEIEIVKAMADRIFYDAMGVLGVPQWQRVVMYTAVSMFGRGNFGNYRAVKN